MTSPITSLQSSVEDLLLQLQNDPTLSLQPYRSLIEDVIHQLDIGALRVGAFVDGKWHNHTWVRQTIMLYFRVMPMHEMTVGPFHYYDKIPLKEHFSQFGVRVVPPATIRRGAFLEPGVVVMPSYVNIGAYVGRGTMVDTWATVGSCAQIGQDVHLSGGVGIGGVLEPASADPVIVEDGAFIGSRAILVEGMRIGKEAVIAANVSLTSSTPIIDTRGGNFREFKGYIPERAVVIPGNKEKEIPGGRIFTACAYIIGERKPSTDKKLSLNAALRDFNVSV